MLVCYVCCFIVIEQVAVAVLLICHVNYLCMSAATCELKRLSAKKIILNPAPVTVFHQLSGERHTGDQHHTTFFSQRHFSSLCFDLGKAFAVCFEQYSFVKFVPGCHVSSQ